MSEPANPLRSFDTSTYRHVLVAFQYTQDADTFKFTESIGAEGTSVSGGCGAGVVVINELKGKRFLITNAEWEYNYNGHIDGMTTTNIGAITVLENVDLSFLDFIYNDVLPKLGDVHISQVGFALKTYFIGSKGTGPDETVSGNQYVFNVSNIVSNIANISKLTNKHILMTMGTSQTVGQLPSYSNIYQMTLTHKDGNLHDQIPKAEPILPGLQLRSTEDGAKYPKRKERIDKSKPMKTLDDIFKAFEVELSEQKSTHKGQLQEWMKKIVDGHVDKMTIPPKQKKQKDADPLPIIYHVDLDDKYKSYMVDNRNIPHEQPEQDQTIKGIRSFGIAPSTPISKMVMSLMLLSKKIGEDTLKSIPDVPRVAISVVRKCDKKQHVHIIIRKIKLPTNTQGINSGPGEGAIKPLTFYVNNTEKEREIVSITGKFSYPTGNTVMEEHTDDYTANIVYGNREQVIFERKQQTPFFDTMYSGVRMMDAKPCNGVEYGDLASAVEGLEAKQHSFLNVLIYGNPDLLNDINRKPLEVANNVVGEANYYKYPEYFPMYMKLLIYQNAYKEQGVNPDPDLEWLAELHGFSQYYHISKVKNIFNSSDETDVSMRGFFQEIEIRRTDDFM